MYDIVVCSMFIDTVSVQMFMRWIAWGKKTVPVPGHSGAQGSVASTGR